MLTVYTNQRDILNSTKATEVSRLESVDAALLDTRDFSVTLKKGTFPNLELHVYTPDGTYLTGNHKALFSIENNDTTSQKVAYQHLSIDLSTELNTLGISRGQYRVVYNLFDNVLGSYDSGKLFIKEISPSRRELRLQLANTTPELVTKLSDLKQRWEELTSNDIFDSFLINFGFNQTYQIINFRFELESEIPEIYVKLYSPLGSRYGEKSKIWISEEVITPVADVITVVPKHEPNPANTLRPANFDLELEDGKSVATDYKSWNDLLSSNVATSQQLIDNFFSGSLSGIKLNVNYRNFDDFVHYSSAVERVENFKYKLQLIESYTAKIKFISGSINDNSDIYQVNLDDVFTKRNAVVSTFDDFEKYLFFESTGSKLYTHYDTTGSIDPWPKKNPNSLVWSEAWIQWNQASSQWQIASNPNIDPYDYFAALYTVDSATAEAYYEDLLEKATIYDRFNVHKLTNTVPLHIQNMEDSDQFLLFVNMLGQHFDILWTYIKQLTSIQTREEHPKDGMPNDLLYSVASSMGINLLNGRSASELWRYSLGTDVSGSYIQDGSNGISSISDENNTKEIWRRIVNNLPYILKTKGTSRSIKALLTCFGIPSSVLTIKEYGGPSTFTDNDHFPEYIHDVYYKAWLSDINTGSLSIPLTTYVNGAKLTVPANTLEFRFKTDNNYQYQSGSYYNIASISSGSVSDVYQLVLSRETENDNEGTIRLFNRLTGNAITASNLEIFDNSWHTVTIESLGNTGSLKIGKALYGNKIYIKSSSFNGDFYAFPTTGTESLILASGSRTLPTPNASTITSVSKFYGHYNEVRIWSGSLNDNSIIEHSTSPQTYTYNVDRFVTATGEEANKPYNHLFNRFTLINANTSGSSGILSSHPNRKINAATASYLGYTLSSSIQFEGFEETFYTPSPSLGGSSLYSNKVRIESSSLDPNKRLNTTTRIEKSSFDRYSLDSNRLGVYFSPQTSINEDIFNQLGYFEIDDYIGDPDDVLKDSYTELVTFANEYWKKYENRNDFEAYFRAIEIYDFTLFKYIKQLIPHRVNLLSGIVVEPNVLERSKAKISKKPTIQDLTYKVTIDDPKPELSSTYHSIETTLDDPGYRLNTVFDARKEATISDLVPNPIAVYNNIEAATISDLVPDPIATYNDIEDANISDIDPTPIAFFDPSRNAEISTLITEIESVNINVPYSTISNTIPEFYSEYLDRGRGVITNVINTNRTGNSWTQNRRIGKYIIQETKTVNIKQAEVTGSRVSSYLLKVGEYYYSTPESASLKLAYSSSLVAADINTSYGLGFQNLRYNGCKLSGPAINVDSPNTVDGGPVVRITKVSPKKVVFSSNQITTLDESVTGIKKRSI
jgi:hypothetical protein